MTLPNNAIARVKALEDAQLVGVAEIVSIFEMYGYRRDTGNQNLWWLNDGTESPGASIEVLDDGEVFVVYSRSRENAGNVNHIARQAGWMSCELTSLDDDANELMLESLLQVEPMSDRITILNGAVATSPAVALTVPHAAEIAAPASGPAPSVPTLLPSTGADVAGADVPTVDVSANEPDGSGEIRAGGAIQSDNADDELLASMQADFERIKTLTQRLAESETARQDVEGHNRSLQRELQEQRSRHALQEIGLVRDSTLDTALMKIIEAHLVTLVDTSKLEADPLVQQLKNGGYEMVVKLTRKVSCD